MPNKYFRKEERPKQIIAVLSIMAEHGIKPELTAYGIAKKLDMRPSYILYAVLADMVAQHLLTVRDEELGNRCTRTWYALPEGSYVLGGERQITLNFGGKSYQEKLI